MCFIWINIYVRVEDEEVMLSKSRKTQCMCANKPFVHYVKLALVAHDEQIADVIPDIKWLLSRMSDARRNNKKLTSAAERLQRRDLPGSHSRSSEREARHDDETGIRQVVCRDVKSRERARGAETFRLTFRRRRSRKHEERTGCNPDAEDIRFNH